MNLVLWIDENTFATTLLEKAFKGQNLAFYSLDHANDFIYLVEDLKPRLIVLDAKTALSQLGSLKQQYESSETLKNLPFIMIDDILELSFIENKIGEIHRPFDPFKIPGMLHEWMKVL